MSSFSRRLVKSTQKATSAGRLNPRWAYDRAALNRKIIRKRYVIGEEGQVLDKTGQYLGVSVR